VVVLLPNLQRHTSVATTQQGRRRVNCDARVATLAASETVHHTRIRTVCAARYAHDNVRNGSDTAATAAQHFRNHAPTR
jgi:hypothetical protein